jgi:hypothetical protein
MNIYNRCFDDQSQLRIRLETGAIEGILELAESGGLELVWSFVLDYENSLNPQEERKEWAELLSQLCIHTIVPSPRILSLARALIKNAKIKPRDALHVACAEALGDVIISLLVMMISFESYERVGALAS